MIDPQPGQLAPGHQIDQQGVRGVEDLGLLHPDRGEGVDVEEAPVVELFGAHPPPGQPVPLPVDEFVHRQVLGARAEREVVVVVAEHRFRAGAVDDELAALEHGSDALAEHGHQHGAVLDVPVDVEPAGEG